MQLYVRTSALPHRSHPSCHCRRDRQGENGSDARRGRCVSSYGRDATPAPLPPPSFDAPGSRQASLDPASSLLRGAKYALAILEDGVSPRPRGSSLVLPASVLLGAEYALALLEDGASRSRGPSDLQEGVVGALPLPLQPCGSAPVCEEQSTDGGPRGYVQEAHASWDLPSSSSSRIDFVKAKSISDALGESNL